MDRATESLAVVRRKCRLYAAYYQSGIEQARGGVFPRVCWIVPNEARAEAFAKLIESDAKLPAGLFVITTNQDAPTILRERGV
jgi:hypothetical protein